MTSDRPEANPAVEPCPSRSKKEGLACAGLEGHGGLHHSRSDRVLVV